MATKPTSTGRWATNGGTRVPPSSGQRDTGWEQGKLPPARFFNDLLGDSGDWASYVQDGQFQVAGGTSPFTFDDDVSITGSGDFSVAGNITGDNTFTGDATFQGEIFHGARTIAIPGIAFDQGTGLINANGQVAVASNFRYAPLFLKAGDHVTDIAVGAIRTAGAGDLTIRIKEANLDIDLGVANIVTVVDPFAVTWTVVTGTLIDLDIATLRAYSIELDGGVDWSGNISGVEITFDRPAP